MPEWLTTILAALKTENPKKKIGSRDSVILMLG